MKDHTQSLFLCEGGQWAMYYIITLDNIPEATLEQEM